MIIDRTRLITKVIAVIAGICAIFGLVFNIVQTFAIFGIIMAICDLVIAFVCFKGIGKDKEISISVYGLLVISEIVNTFISTSTNFTIASIIVTLIKIIGYMTIILYLLGIISKKVIPVIGGLMVSGFFIYNTIKLIYSFMNLFSTLDNFIFPQSLISTSIITCIATVIYVVPALSMVILISCGAVVVNNKK